MSEGVKEWGDLKRRKERLVVKVHLIMAASILLLLLISSLAVQRAFCDCDLYCGRNSYCNIAKKLEHGTTLICMLLSPV